MSIEFNALLDVLTGKVDAECFSKVRSLLVDDGVRLVDGAPTQEKVKDLLPTLRARKENSSRTGKKIFGLSGLIETLTRLSGQDVVLGYGFISPRAAGNIYVANDGRQGLGAVVVDR